MSARTLRNLIRASGFAGIAGQSFRNHVLGAASGAKMSDYRSGGISTSGEPAPNGVTYNDNAGFTVTVSLGGSARWSYIKNVGAGKFSITPSLSPDGFAVVSPASTVNAADPSSASFSVRAPYNGTRTTSGSVWFTGYVQPARPATTGPEPAQFYGIVTSDPPTGTSNVSVQMGYWPDAVQDTFNPFMSVTWPFTMNNRQYPTDTAQFQWEWYNNPSYTGTPVSTSPTYSFTTSPGTTMDLWLRTRLVGTTIWTNYGLVHWADPRPIA